MLATVDHWPLFATIILAKFLFHRSKITHSRNRSREASHAVLCLKTVSSPGCFYARILDTLVRGPSKSKWTKPTNTSKLFAEAKEYPILSLHSTPKWWPCCSLIPFNNLIVRTLTFGLAWYTVMSCSGLCSKSEVKKKNGDELFTLKAYNGRVALSWLNHTLMSALQQHPNHDVLILTSSAMILGRIVYYYF